MSNNHLKILAMAALLSMSNSALAHHSFSATFKSDETISVDGVVTEFRFRNPHVLIYLNTTNEDGSTTNWMAEGSSATGWRRSGWDKDDLKPGDMLRITGNSTIDGSPMVSIEEFALLDVSGKNVIAELSDNENPSVALGQTATAVAENHSDENHTIPLRLASGQPNFTGVTIQKDGMIPSSPGGPDADDPALPYNEVGKAALASWDLKNDPQVFCEQPGVVRQAGYTPYGFKLTQYSDHITIEYEEYGTGRSIFFDDELPKPGVRSHMGDSVARYEGDALVIETVNLLANASGHRGRPLSDEARVTEVYTRIDMPEFGSIVQTETTVVDPKFLTESWSIKRYKLYVSDYEFIENECTQPLRERPGNVFQYSDFDLKFISDS